MGETTRLCLQQLDVAGYGGQRHNDMEAASRACMPEPTSPLSGREVPNTVCSAAPALAVSSQLLCSLPLCSLRRWGQLLSFECTLF